jgi:hypothetical protein
VSCSNTKRRRCRNTEGRAGVDSGQARAAFGLTLRRKTAQAMALRARIVLAFAKGADNQDVAVRERVTKQTMYKSQARFVAQRLDGLPDASRPGAPRTIDDARVSKESV